MSQAEMGQGRGPEKPKKKFKILQGLGTVFKSRRKMLPQAAEISQPPTLLPQVQNEGDVVHIDLAVDSTGNTVQDRIDRIHVMTEMLVFDLSPAEDQQRMLQEIRDTGASTSTTGVRRRARAISRLAELHGLDAQTAQRRLESLEAAGEAVPGIKAQVVSFYAEGWETTLGERKPQAENPS